MKYKILLYLVAILAFFLILALKFTNILVYFILGAVLGTILRPLTNYISQTQLVGIRFPRSVAVALSFSILVGVVWLFITLFIPVVSAQVDVLTELNYERIFTRISMPVERLESFLIENDLTERDAGFLSQDFRTAFGDFLRGIEISTIINSVISYTGQFLIGLIAVVFVTFFILYEDNMLRRNFVAIIPNQYFEMSISAIAKIEMLLSNYLAGLLVQMLSIFTLASLGLSLFGIKFALTIALFAAVANLIPYLGPLLGATFGVVISLGTSVGMLDSPNAYLILIAKILLVFGVVQLIDNIVLQPFIFSKSVKAHPLEIFVVIFAGASIAQIPGMILAIPAYTILRVSVVELLSGYKQYRIFRY